MADKYVAIQDSRLVYYRGRSLKHPDLKCLRVPLSDWTKLMGDNFPDQFFVKGIIHEMVDVGTTYSFSSHRRHIRELQQIEQLLKEARAVGDADLERRLQSAFDTISKQIPQVVVTSDEERLVDQLCSLLCTLPSETSVGMLPLDGLKISQVTVEGEFACLHLEGLFSVSGDVNTESADLIWKMFGAIKICAMQLVSKNVLALHLLVSRGEPSLALPGAVLQLRPASARTVYLHNSALLFLNASKKLDKIAEGEEDEQEEGELVMVIVEEEFAATHPADNVVGNQAEGDPAPAAQQADVQRALDLVQQVAGQRGSSLLPPPASIAWAAAGSRRRTSLPVPPQPDVLNVADQEAAVLDLAAAAAPVAAAVAQGAAAVAAAVAPVAPVDVIEQQFAPLAGEEKASGASEFVKKLAING